MQYDIKLTLHYDYDASVAGGRHLIRVMPQTVDRLQRVVAASLSFSPKPAERSDFLDFFGNGVTSIAFADVHETLDVRMTARVRVDRPPQGLDVSPEFDGMRAELGAALSLGPSSPHHFVASSDHAGITPDITTYAGESAEPGISISALAERLCMRIHRDFDYDGDATTVATRAVDAFKLKRGVCQDFSHVMIAGLRGLRIPAGYVSGFLRTIPPPGKERLEGADAMHAWVKVWCGREAGWQEFDPTNAMRAGADHITVGYGRDYADVSPIVGILRTSGRSKAKQSVDVIPVD